MNLNTTKVSKKFRSPLDPVIVYTEKCDSHIIIDYGFDISKYGEAKIIKTGETDFYKLIQSYKDAADLSCVLAQFRQTGDKSILNQRSACFGDTKDFPTSFVEAQNIILKERFKTIDDISKRTGKDYSSLSEKELSKLSSDTLSKQLFEKLLPELNKYLDSKKEVK